MNPNIEQQIANLTRELQNMKQIFTNHQHANDGTAYLRKNIFLDRDQWLGVGTAQFITGQPYISGINGDGTPNILFALAESVGPDAVTEGFVNKSKNMQMELIHFPNNPGTSRLRAYASPLVTALESSSISTTAGGTTTTITGYSFDTDSLAGAFIVIINKTTGAVIEQRTITSNTATVITISGTWGSSSTGEKFRIYRPVGLGDQEVNYRILYLGEGTSAGVRFGGGLTSGGQNGLLYMDATGDLYWRNKANVATKLN